MNNFLSKALWHICFLDDGGEKYKDLVIGLFKPHPPPFFFFAAKYTMKQNLNLPNQGEQNYYSPLGVTVCLIISTSSTVLSYH